MGKFDYVITGSKSAEVVDSVDLGNGTVFEAVASGSGSGFVKKVTNADGTVTETIINAAKGKSQGGRTRGGTKRSINDRKRSNTALILEEFNAFKETLAAAENAEGLTYDDSNLTIGGSGFLKPDRSTTLDLVDASGNVIGTLGGSIGGDEEEAARAKRLADEIIGLDLGSSGDDGDGDGDGDDDDNGNGNGSRLPGADKEAGVNLPEALGGLGLGPESGPAPQAPQTPAEAAADAEAALGEVGAAAAAAMGGDLIGDTTQTTSSFSQPEATAETTELTNQEIEEAAAAAGDTPSAVSGTSILTSVPEAVQTVSSGTATGGQMEADAAISVGPAEDEAIDMYTKGRRASILTRPGGLLTSEDEEEDPRLRRRRSLLAG